MEKKSPDESEKMVSPSSELKPIDQMDDDEKESPEQSKLLEPSTEVKFISAENGDAKIDIENVRLVFSGMNKEELMKFANDPFWVRLRWFLFILFWLAWIGMLAGAIAIIFFAPKCPAAAPREWWEKGPLVPVNMETFAVEKAGQASPLKALADGLDDLSYLGMKGLLLSSILHVEGSGSTAAAVDFKDVDPRYGTLSDFKTLVSKANDKSIKLMLTLSPNHSSRKHAWFNKSMSMEAPYSNYYVWADGKGTGKKQSPNEWLSIDEGSAWEWSEQRKQFYLHQFSTDMPDLNFREPQVIAEFKDIFSFWIKQGVSGFVLNDASYLLEDKDLRNDPIAPAGEQVKNSTHKDYGFYRHIYTRNVVGNVDLISELKQSLVVDGTSVGIFAADIDGTADDIAQYYGESEETRVVELPLFNLAKHLPSTITIAAPQLQQTIEQWLYAVPDNVWPNWMIPEGAIPEDIEGAVNMAVSLLQGTPITSYAANIPAAANTSTEHRTLMHGLSQARESPSILYGPLNVTVIDQDVMGYIRMKSGNPGYLVLLNLGSADKIINAKEFPSVPDEVSVQLRSPGFKDDSIQEKGKLESERVPVPAKSALVLTFVPEKH